MNHFGHQYQKIVVSYAIVNTSWLTLPIIHNHRTAHRLELQLHTCIVSDHATSALSTAKSDVFLAIKIRTVRIKSDKMAALKFQY